MSGRRDRPTCSSPEPTATESLMISSADRIGYKSLDVNMCFVVHNTEPRSRHESIENSVPSSSVASAAATAKGDSGPSSRGRMLESGCGPFRIELILSPAHIQHSQVKSIKKTLTFCGGALALDFAFQSLSQSQSQPRLVFRMRPNLLPADAVADDEENRDIHERRASRINQSPKRETHAN